MVKIAAALLVAGVISTEASTSFESIAETINSGNHGWTAQAPSKFANVEDVMPYLGAFLPGDEQFEEPAVVELVPTNAALPEEFDSATNWPKCSVIGNVRDQSACGSCWAFGSVASFESRRCIVTGEDTKFSPEDTAFCQGIFGAGNGCNGGNSAWNFFKNTGVVTGGDFTDAGSGDSCLPYSFAPCAHHVPATASYPACPSGEYPSPRCAKACSEDGFSGTYSGDKHMASSAYSVRTVSQIQQDLVENGPMYVAFSVYGDFPTYKSGVYTHQTGSYLGGHAVTLVGYGTLDGTPYWKIKNSWNEEWGAGGHFLIKRGSNECGIEGNVNAGAFSSSEVVSGLAQEPRQYAKGFVRQPRNAAVPVGTISDEERASAPSKLDYTTTGATSAVKDQGSCGSCWAFSATQGIESAVFRATGTMPKLSTQQIIACDKTDGGCNGGDLPTAFDYVESDGGIDSDSNYPDTSHRFGITGSCKSHSHVAKVTDYKYAVAPCSGGSCSSQDEDGLKAALAKNGPLSVCVNAESWNGYYGGVMTGSCSGSYNSLDHCVQLVGYDTTASTPYWIVKNSWGSSWGETGHIWLPMGQNSCGIADEAMYVTAELATVVV